MFPNKGTPGGCGICVVIAKSDIESIYIGNKGSIEEEIRVAESCEKRWKYIEEKGGMQSWLVRGSEGLRLA